MLAQGPRFARTVSYASVYNSTNDKVSAQPTDAVATLQKHRCADNLEGLNDP